MISLRRKSFRVKTSALVGAFLFATTVAPLQDARAEEHLRVMPGEYVVTVPTRAAASAISSAAMSPRFSSSVATVSRAINREALVVRVLSAGDAAGLASTASADGSRPYDPTQDRCKEILAEGRAVSCSPNWVVRAAEIPNDPRYSELWGMGETRGIDAPGA